MGTRRQVSRLQITVPRFDFRKLVLAHGWVFLSPFKWNDERGLLVRPLCLADNRRIPVAITVRSRESQSTVTARIHANDEVSQSDRNALREQIRRMLRLDEDFSEFHKYCEDDPDLKFVAQFRCGGLLRAPTAFEDLVKTTCTTNCDWRNTKKMCEALCTLGNGSFPTPGELLPYSPERLARLAPVGYRSGTIIELARKCSEGRLSLDAWAREGAFSRIKEALAEIRGFGPYSVNHMLMLLGAYESIPVDSEVLAYLRQTHFQGRSVKPSEAVEPYSRYGQFRFLAFKFGRMGRKMNYIDK